ncbi:MAG: hypothetical protein JRG92_15095 [Deltaproteobacteria bacterium]|nr:hypothetical protein [Deltaproteobacteria bacterium]MBW2384956.1 hypothetical protein [Deltaproteobacteria bacterium]
MTWRTDLHSLDGPFRSLREPGRWLWAAALVGFALRVHFAVFTPGTLDVVVWDGHAQEIAERGLIAYYHGGRFTFNHPPLSGLLVTGLWNLAQTTPFSFAFLLRAPFALLDAGTALLLVTWLAGARNESLRRGRFVIGALYWLSPLAIVYSAHHGNTDSAVAFFLVAAALFASREHAIACGFALGLGLWVKIPGILVAPLLFMALPSWRARMQLVVTTTATALVGYLPWLVQDSEVIVRAVFLYPGLLIRTPGGTPIWGMQVFYPAFRSLSDGPHEVIRAFTSAWYAWNTLVCLVPIVAWSWMRRGRRTPEDLAMGIAGVYVILYGLSNFWAFQYLAWSLPFWLVCGLPFAISATLVATAYVYGLYAWLCGDWLMRGEWRFIALPDWPMPILLARNVAVVFFFVTALLWLAKQTREEIGRWRANSDVR